MGFDPNLAILFSGIATLLFFVVVGGRVPSYLGSSFAFIAVVIAATGYGGSGPNPNLAVALGGIIAAGAVYAMIGIAGDAGGRCLDRPADAAGGDRGDRRGDRPQPRAGRREGHLGLRPRCRGRAVHDPVGPGLPPPTCPGLRGACRSLIGAAASTLLYGVLANGFGLAKPLDLGRIAQAPWFGWPHVATPVFEPSAIWLIAPSPWCWSPRISAT